jgi:hypothetical protein
MQAIAARNHHTCKLSKSSIDFLDLFSEFDQFSTSMSTTENQPLPVAVDGPTWVKYDRDWVLRALWNPEAYRM